MFTKKEVQAFPAMDIGTALLVLERRVKRSKFSAEKCETNCQSISLTPQSIYWLFSTTSITLCSRNQTLLSWLLLPVPSPLPLVSFSSIIFSPRPSPLAFFALQEGNESTFKEYLRLTAKKHIRSAPKLNFFCNWKMSIEHLSQLRQSPQNPVV